jgi:hypothetical protein
MTTVAGQSTGARASASKIAKWLVDRARVDEAIQILAAYAATGPNDVEGQQLLAEALRLDPASQIARQAFERMEGIHGDHAGLEQAIVRFNTDAVARFEREMRPASFRRAQVGFNNNVKYKGAVYHVQTEDSGLDKPHIITHLFADGGRVIKTHKRNYNEHVTRDDVAKFVRALMKGQHMEMLLFLREGKFDYVIEGRGMGGVEVLTEPPNVDVKRLGKKKEEDTSDEPTTEVTAAATVAAAAAPKMPSIPPPDTQRTPRKARCHLVVQRSLVGGPAQYSVMEDEVILGSTGAIQLEGETFCHPSEAAIRVRDERLWLEDLEGGNGAFLRIRSRVELTTGDEFIVGDQMFRVEKNPVADDEPDPGPTYFYSSPKWPSTFRVTQIFEGGGLGACAMARGGMVQIGSAIGDIVTPNDPLVSEQHCVLEEQAGVVILTDLDSRTGVFVRLQGEGELTDGDEVIIGRTRLLVDLSPMQTG